MSKNDVCKTLLSELHKQIGFISNIKENVEPLEQFDLLEFGFCGELEVKSDLYFFIKYLFDNKLELDKNSKIFHTPFFKNNIIDNDFDKILPFCSLPKNNFTQIDLLPTFFNKQNNTFSIHSFIRDSFDHFELLIISLNMLKNKNEKLNGFIRKYGEIMPELIEFNDDNYQLITLNDNEQYLKIQEYIKTFKSKKS